MGVEAAEGGEVGSGAEVVAGGFGVVFSAGVGVSGLWVCGAGGQHGGVEGGEVAVAGVGVAFDDCARLVGDGGGAVLLVAVRVEVGGAGAVGRVALADEFVDVAAPDVDGLR